MLYYGTSKQTNESVAMKYYNFTLPDAQQAVRTMSLLTRLNHPNLVKYYGVFESSKQTCVVQELAKETLVQHIINKKYYYEDECRGYVRQIVDAVTYLHELNIPFGNIKVSNILIQDEVVKLSDYAHK